MASVISLRRYCVQTPPVKQTDDAVQVVYQVTS